MNVKWNLKEKLSGEIPEKITYISKKLEKIRRTWDDVESKEENSIEVYPTYPIDASNKKTLETARNWAISYGSKKLDEEITLDNKPLDSIVIINLEIRSEGGRAYKVLVNDKFYCDLREDVLLDSILEEGIEKGGKLKGKYIWGRLGSQMKIIRVGSALHSALIQATEKKNVKNISPKDFVIGGMYASKTGAVSIYLGRYDAEEIETQGNPYYRKNNVHTYKIVPIRDQMLWLETDYTIDNTHMLDWHKKLLVEEGSTYCINYRKNKSVIEKVGQMDIPTLEQLKETNRKVTERRNMAEGNYYHLPSIKLMSSRPVGEPQTNLAAAYINHMMKTETEGLSMLKIKEDEKLF